MQELFHFGLKAQGFLLCAHRILNQMGLNNRATQMRQSQCFSRLKEVGLSDNRRRRAHQETGYLAH